jgi:hypothetical protein
LVFNGITDRISRLVLAGAKANHPENRDPRLAPAFNAGANTPPAAPEVKEKTGQMICNRGMYQ